MVFGIFSDGSWTAFGRLSEGLRSCAVVAQKPLEVALGTPQRGQNRPLEVPKASQEHPKCGQERPRAPKSVQERPKSAPRASQERPKSVSRAPHSAQERAKRAKLAAKMVPEEPQEASQGTPERPRGPLRKFGYSTHPRKLQHAFRLVNYEVFSRSRLLRQSYRSRR